MKKIALLITLLLVCLTGCKLTEETVELTGQQVQDVLDTIVFDSNESAALFTINSTNGVDLEFKYSISETNSYFKTEKKIDNELEINVLYKENNKYYLKQTIGALESNVELNAVEALVLLNKVISEQDSYYDNIKVDVSYISDATKTTNGDEIILNFIEVVNGYFYTTTVKINGTKLVSLEKEFTKDGSVNKISFVTQDLVLTGGNA